MAGEARREVGGLASRSIERGKAELRNAKLPLQANSTPRPTRILIHQSPPLKRPPAHSDLFAAIVQTSSDAILTADRDGRITSWNAASELLLGYTASEITGKPLDTLVPEDCRDQEECAASAIGRGESVLPYDTVRQRKDGTSVYVSVATSVLRDEAGRIIGSSQIVRDISARKNEENELLGHTYEILQRNTRLSDALIAGGGGTFRWNINTDEFEWDESLARLLGRSSAEVETLSDFFNALHPDDYVKVQSACALCLADGIDFNLEFRVVWPDQSIRWLSARGKTIFDQTSRPCSVAGVCVDVTERRRYEGQLQDQRDVLRGIVAGAPLEDVLESLTLAVERRAERPVIATILLMNKDGDQLIPTAGHRIPAGWSRLIEDIKIGPNVGSCGSAAYQGERVIVSDIQSDPRWEPLKDEAAAFGLGACWSSPIFSASGDVLGTFAVYHPRPAVPSEWELHLVDVLTGTAAIAIERRNAEDALRRADAAVRESEERFRNLANNIAQFAWIADAKGWIFWYNQRWLDYTGTTLEEMQGWGWTKVHHPAHVDRVIKSIQKSWDSGAPWEDTFPLRARDGTYRWFLSRARPVRDKSGQVLYWFGTNTDVTEMTTTTSTLECLNLELEGQVEESTHRLQETIGELEQFSYSIMHDMRAPLRSLLGFAHILLDEYEETLNEEGRFYLRHIATSADRMDGMVRDVLNYSRILHGKFPMETVEIEPLLREILGTYPLFRRHKKEIFIEGEFPKVEGNPAALTQCFSNLLENAIKFVPRGTQPRVRVWAELRGEQVRLNFQDNGVGIPREQQDNIFDPFRQLNRDHGGSGIGLAIVRKSTSRMGGSAGVESEPGHGSLFWLELNQATDRT